MSKRGLRTHQCRHMISNGDRVSHRSKTVTASVASTVRENKQLAKTLFVSVLANI